MKLLFLSAALTFLASAYGYEAQVTKGQMAPELEVLLAKASRDTGKKFSADDFLLIEERNLATSKFTMYVQSNSMVPVDGTAVRIWSDLKTNELILAEMHLDEKTQVQKDRLINRYMKAKFSAKAIKSKQLADSISELVQKVVSQHDSDAKILGMKYQDRWQKGDLVRKVEVRGRRGVHYITISLLKNEVIDTRYQEFLQSENFSLKANVYPVYEEVEGSGEKLSTELRELKYLNTHVHDGGDYPLGELTDMKFPEAGYSVMLAGTPLGDELGLWSEASVRHKAEEYIKNLPLRPNGENHGVLLQGKYATINLHPEVKEAFQDLTFTLQPSIHHLLQWEYGPVYQAQVKSGFIGKVISSQQELLTRIPFRDPEHSAVAYINSGFDEVQVYYGVTALMESLVALGFTDPELSEKPFHAFLFDPDISMKDNAYYYDNTINFTTYNPGTPNLARDNPTIWHELGHAIMERLMGVHLNFESQGGYGGLSEGMADFIAQIVLEHQIKGALFPGKDNFRIMNSIGFDLTNEFHDEGEAYGGAMNDMLTAVIASEGEEGLHAFTDLTLETMRLTRNHPKLTARSWFEHMLYADQLGSAVREAGQYQELIESALAARNFSFEKDFKAATMVVRFNKTELTSQSLGSRNAPLKTCDPDYLLKLSLTAGDSNFIKFPAMIKVEYQEGALQGAIKWEGEEENPQIYTINSEEEILSLPIKASLECDYINRPNGSCRDYAYLQIYNEGIAKPVAKKRFYLEINPQECSSFAK